MRTSRFAFLLFLAACGGGDSGTNNPPPPPPPSVSAVTVSVTPATVVTGATAQAAAVATSSTGATITGKSVAWVSTNTAVATISGTGLVSGVTPGTATITATIDGVVGSAAVTVTPPPVASVIVTVSAPTLAIGTTVQATATARSAAGAVLPGKTVVWTTSNPLIATVAASGIVTGVAAGAVTIIGTVEGVAGTIGVTVTLPPVATVAITGTSRVKVGDQYQYTAQARLADGTLVQRPVTWSVIDPSKGTITAGGLFTPSQSGVIGIRASVEGVVFDGQVTGYDWVGFGAAAVVGAFVPADLTISNKFGQSEYPDLVIGCSNGTFVLYVDTENFVTQNGLVSYSFDAGTIFSSVWLEFDLFSALGHPGPTNLTTKNFASLVALSRLFTFAFTEFNSTAKATTFRVTGMAPYLTQMLNACPSNAIRAAAPTDEMREEFRALRKPSTMSAERQQRIDRGTQGSPAPGLVASSVAIPTLLPKYQP